MIFKNPHLPGTAFFILTPADGITAKLGNFY